MKFYSFVRRVQVNVEGQLTNIVELTQTSTGRNGSSELMKGYTTDISRGVVEGVVRITSDLQKLSGVDM